MNNNENEDHEKKANEYADYLAIMSENSAPSEDQDKIDAEVSKKLFNNAPSFTAKNISFNKCEATKEETRLDAHMYEVKEEHAKQLGFYTLAEYAAYEKGREHGESVTIDFVRKWDGKTNSVFGAILKLKFDYLKQSGF